MSGKKANQSITVVRGVGAEIALNASGGVAEWIMLVPIASGLVATIDGRGPYRIADAAKLAQASLNAHGGRIPIDENHATDLAAPNGGPSPARGWIVEMQARPDGIHGRVEWSSAGSALMSEKAYRFISPVLIHDKSGNVLDVPRVSLTNTPNLRDMTALNSTETSMDLLAQLRKLLGLADDADEATAIDKIKSLNSSTSLQSIAKAAGLKDDADAATIAATVTTLATGAKGNGAETIAALQSEVKDLGERLTAALNTSASDKATAFVDGAIREGRVGVKPLRDHYISMHMADPARVEKEINAMPKIGNSAILPSTPPEVKDGKVSLNAEQLATAKLLGIKPDDYAKTLASEISAD
ncbi:phage protease [Bradyrhizobium sp. 31Argb]|uniref:phage protease n=1 Tax=Bradyrhizobium sp. 31Argb TaxID=3141247 RepID=UPI00374A4D15